MSWQLKPDTQASCIRAMFDISCRRLLMNSEIHESKMLYVNICTTLVHNTAHLDLHGNFLFTELVYEPTQGLSLPSDKNTPQFKRMSDFRLYPEDVLQKTHGDPFYLLRTLVTSYSFSLCAQKTVLFCFLKTALQNLLLIFIYHLFWS